MRHIKFESFFVLHGELDTASQAHVHGTDVQKFG